MSSVISPSDETLLQPAAPLETVTPAESEVSEYVTRNGEPIVFSLRIALEGVLNHGESTAFVGKLLEGFRWGTPKAHVHEADHNHVVIADIALPNFHAWQQLNAQIRSRLAGLDIKSLETDIGV